MRNRIVSGIQPTGSLHLGNYLGSIRQWLPLQQQAECIFLIVDSHAITIPQNPASLRASIRQVAATYIACGIDPATAIICAQSSVSAHAELAWIFNCLTPLGWLQRMTQFKDKSTTQREGACLGLLAYPVLQAADILLYHPKLVPVGEDQKQHIELTRDIALLFNRTVGEDYFHPPEPQILSHGARIMSLRDGLKKMSKSDPSDASRIDLTDDADSIAQKIRRAKSDAELISLENLDARPELHNLLTIYALFANTTLAAAATPFIGKGFSALKEALAELLVASLTPLRSEILRLTADPSYLDQILKAGTTRATAIANPTLQAVKDKIGLWQG